MYDCEKENQKYLDSLHIKSKCCNDELIATTDDEYICICCGEKEE